MAWTDKPTEAQIASLFHLMRWCVPIKERVSASQYLKKHATRKDVSDELGRIRKLCIDKKLTKSACFDSVIWANYCPSKEEDNHEGQ